MHLPDRNRKIEMILLPHLPILWVLLSKEHLIPYIGASAGMRSAGTISLLLRTLLILIYIVNACLLHIMPYRDKCRSSVRIRIMYGGHLIIRFCLWGLLFQLVILLLRLPFRLAPTDVAWPVVLLADGIFDAVHFYLLILNGYLRILCTCRSIGIWKRVLFLCFLWIPVLHLFFAKYLSRRACEEFDAERCRFENRLARTDSQICATRYPLLMLHGIGFRDLRYFNYWGRIPKELVRNGAVVYYGHQEAWGTIEENAEIIRRKILEVLEENHCDKVNIIAHSKGGLDARYLISALHMEDQVASLTTISTPHQGSELLNLLNRLPDNIYHFVSSLFDRSFSRFGDQHPDCYHASKQLSPEFCREFNAKYPDSPEVYYQSYASVLKHPLGDDLLSIPHLLMNLSGASRNDGLVTEGSAKWGTFKKTFISTGRRGISHGDMIDLKREDYKGFDVIEAYVGIVAELREMGF